MHHRGSLVDRFRGPGPCGVVDQGPSRGSGGSPGEFLMHAYWYDNPEHIRLEFASRDLPERLGSKKPNWLLRLKQSKKLLKHSRNG